MLGFFFLLALQIFVTGFTTLRSSAPRIVGSKEKPQKRWLASLLSQSKRGQTGASGTAARTNTLKDM